VFYNDVVVDLQAYCVTRDRASLSAAITKLQQELDNPTIQGAVIKLPITADEFEQTVTLEGSYKLSPTDSGIIDGPVVAGKFVRLLASDSVEGSALLMTATYVDDKIVVLVPLT
jgi:hypothetical protein